MTHSPPLTLRSYTHKLSDIDGRIDGFIGMQNALREEVIDMKVWMFFDDKQKRELFYDFVILIFMFFFRDFMQKWMQTIELWGKKLYSTKRKFTKGTSNIYQFYANIRIFIFSSFNTLSMSTSETLMQQYRKEKEDEFQWQGVLKADRGTRVAMT